MVSLQLNAHAKINFGLHIANKRKDGYHNIETVFQEIDLSDKILLESIGHNKIEMMCDHPMLPIGEENICYKAAELLKKRNKINLGIKIILSKNIPVSAGLGGGSSDAAAILKGLISFWKIQISNDELTSLALRLGSDVPFFLNGGTALGRGRGEILEPIEYNFLNHFPYVLVVYPGIFISTAAVYKNFHPTLTINKKSVKFSGFLKGFVDEIPKELFGNDFEPYVFQKYPEIKQIKDDLYRLNAVFASLSGTGSTVYGCFSDQNGAITASNHFKKKYQTFLTRPIG